MVLRTVDYSPRMAAFTRGCTPDNLLGVLLVTVPVPVEVEVRKVGEAACGKVWFFFYCPYKVVVVVEAGFLGISAPVAAQPIAI